QSTAPVSGLIAHTSPCFCGAMRMSRPSVVVASDDEAEKSQSGPGGDGEFAGGYGMPRPPGPPARTGAPPGAAAPGAPAPGAPRPAPPPPPLAGPAARPGITCWQPLCHTSNGIACMDNSTFPVSMFTAI